MGYRAPRPLEGPDVPNVQASKTVTIDMPADGVYYGVSLTYLTGGNKGTRAQLEAAIAEIRVLLTVPTRTGEKVTQIQRYSPARLHAFLDRYGVPVQPGVHDLLITTPWREDDTMRKVTRWGMADVKKFRIEVDFTAAAVNPDLTVQMEKTFGSEPLGDVLKIDFQDIQITRIGERQERTLPAGDRSVSWMFFEQTDGDVGHLEIELDQDTVWEQSRTANADFLARKGLAVQAGSFFVPFDHDNSPFSLFDPQRIRQKQNDGTEILVPHQTYLVTLDMTAANDVELYQINIGRAY